MSFEELLKQIVREVIREELQALSGGDNLLTAEQVAETLGYSRHTVYQLKREKKLRAVVLGDNSLRFRRSEVDRFIDEREQEDLADENAQAI